MSVQLLSPSMVSSCPVLSVNTDDWDPVAEIDQYPVLTETHTHIQLEPGQQVLIVLRSNPTTGFTWTLNESKGANLQTTAPYLKLVNCKYQRSPSPSQIVGAGGYEYWLFELDSSAKQCDKTQSIHLDYARSWESRTHVKELTFTVDIKH